MYTITKDEKNFEGEVKTIFGIRCDETNIADVSANRDEVSRLVAKLNKYKLSPCHLNDVVEDFILDLEAE